MENIKTLNINSDQSGPSFDLPHLIVTILVGAVAVGLVIAQFSYAQDPNSQISLANLDKRVPVLRQIHDPVEREYYGGLGLSYNARRMAAALMPDARVYMTGMTGHSNQPALGFYYFYRNYLFPRDLEITLDKGHFGKGGYFGTSTDDPEVAKTNGFDVMIRFENNNIQPILLNPKAAVQPAQSQ